MGFRQTKMATTRGWKTEIKLIYIMKQTTFLLIALFGVASLFSGCQNGDIYQPWYIEQAKKRWHSQAYTYS